ncbi:MAG: MobF family relaxase, partial [Lacunisphaera sp.]|nr:MobF family relaxase [Lacunisphaera sp.]
MAKIRNGSTYLGKHLSANDYYSKKESVTGEWVGQAAERLGLAGRSIGAKDEAFERLRQNEHPLTGRRLTARTGTDRIVFLDFQCSAPKSVSMLAVTFGDERLRTAHQEAVTVAFTELERFAARRVRAGAAAWSEQTSVTGNLCAARFEHDASRALDAQLHTHLVTANATYDAGAGRWFALTERQMLAAIRYAGKVYQNELARQVIAAGYEIETTRNIRGAIEGFEITGIAPEERAQASKRRAQIEKEIVAFVSEHGRDPTTREVHAMTMATRDPKLAEITTAEVRERQRAEFAPERAAELDQLVAVARSRGPVAVEAAGEASCLQQARDHLFERASVQHGHEILAEALNQDLGKVSLDALKTALADGKATDFVVLQAHPDQLAAPFATRAGLQQELEAIRFVNAGREADYPLGSLRFQPDPKLSLDQCCVVKSLLASTDTVCALRGIAGTGKTTTLQEVQRGLDETSRAVIACAPTTAAAQELRTAGFASATTLEGFLRHSKTAKPGELGRGTTLIVDEAGIAGNRQGAELLERVRDHDLRLILVGDTKQHSGVEAGDFLSVLERHSRLRTFELTDIRRQTTREYRAAVKVMAEGQAHTGLSAIDRLGWLHEAKGGYIKQAAEHYVANLAQKCDTLLVAPTWEEIHRLTDAVRAGLKQRGLLGAGETTTVGEPLGWTKAQAAKATNYQPGHLLMFHQDVRGSSLTNGSTAEVVGVKRGLLRVRDMSGSEHLVSLARHSGAWTVAQPRKIELAPGDQVLIRQNQRAAKLVNGDVLTLESRQPSGAWIARDCKGCAKQIPADFRALAHGYAVTSHKAQGRTADHVIVCAAKLDAQRQNHFRGNVNYTSLL